MANKRLFAPIPTSGIAYFMFSAPIDQSSEQALMATCHEMINKKISTIYLMISTPGGAVVSGINLYNFLRALPIRLITHNMGSVDSIGTVVFLAGSERYASPHTTFMFHGAARNVKGSVTREALEAHLEALAADQEKIASVIRERARFRKPEDVSLLFRTQSTHGTDFALSHGIIHGERRANIPKGAPIAHFARNTKGNEGGRGG